MEIKILASGSSGNAYVVNDGKTILLLDAGIPFTQIQKGMNYKTSQISACLVTHRHGDHAKAVPKLLERGIPVYGPSDLSKEWDGIVKELWVSNKKDLRSCRFPCIMTWNVSDSLSRPVRPANGFSI